MGIAIKHPVPERVKPSFVIYDIQALWRSALSVRVSRVPGWQKLQKRFNPFWHRMPYSYTHMATVSIKGLSTTWTVQRSSQVVLYQTSNCCCHKNALKDHSIWSSKASSRSIKFSYKLLG